MRLDSTLPPPSGAVHRAPSLDLRFSRRRRVRRPVVIDPGCKPRPPVLPWELFPDEDAAERKLGRRALLAALAFHAVFLLTVWPHIDLWPEPDRPERVRKVYVVQQVRYRAPLPPPAGGRQPPRERRKLIPVPDLTPNLMEIWVPELPELEIPQLDLPIPLGPPGPPGPAASASANGDSVAWTAVGERHGARQVTDDMTPPIKIYSPQPEYTEAAREKKLEGFVVVETIIDANGDVVEAKVRKGLPQGLSESAVEAVKDWKFKPATRAGRPVAVYLIVSVTFRLH